MKRRRLGTYFDMFLSLAVGATIGMNLTLPSVHVQASAAPEPATAKVNTTASCDEQLNDRCHEQYAGVTFRGGPICSTTYCGLPQYLMIPGWVRCEFRFGYPFTPCRTRSLSAVSWWSHLDEVEHCCDGVDNNGDGDTDNDCDPLCRFGFPPGMQRVIHDGTDSTVVITTNQDDAKDAGSASTVHLTSIGAGY